MRKLAFNYSKLKGRIVEKYGSQRAFAQALGQKDQTISRKLNNTVGITKEEIIEWSAKLGIDSAEYGAYFFAKEV